MKLLEKMTTNLKNTQHYIEEQTKGAVSEKISLNEEISRLRNQESVKGL